MVAVPETAARLLDEPRTPVQRAFLFLNLKVMLTSKQYDQLFRETDRLESLCRGNELETGVPYGMRNGSLPLMGTAAVSLCTMWI